ncbi:MAG: hypothetical protein C0467_23630 [Planctomycetaceae bacterium]|nr:hypothetical protein [Planctomycetaceae bacterium]
MFGKHCLAQRNVFGYDFRTPPFLVTARRTSAELLMPVTYTCPNPDCGANLKTPARVAVGKSVKCPKCGRSFTPETEEAEAPAGAGTLKFADDGPKKPVSPAKPKPAPKVEKKEEPAPAAATSPFADDDDESAESIKRGYGITLETEEEKKEAEKHRPKFTDVEDKFKKSARGPAMALTVMPSNLMTLEGLLTVAFGLLWFLQGSWPLIFSDAPPGEEELEEAIVDMIVGLVVFVWGAMVCFGASQLQELGSYPWAMTGSIMGIFPLLVGAAGILALQNPAVKAGFAESAGGPDDDEEEDDEDEDEDEDDEDEDEDEDEDDEEEEVKKKVKKPVKPVNKAKTKKRKDDDDEDDE